MRRARASSRKVTWPHAQEADRRDDRRAGRRRCDHAGAVGSSTSSLSELVRVDPAVSEETHEIRSRHGSTAPARSARPGRQAWYVVHTYSGHEQKAKRRLLERAQGARQGRAASTRSWSPRRQVVELVKGEKRTSTRKFFPGYILVHMELNDETWHIVQAHAARSPASSAARQRADADLGRRSRADDAADEGRRRQAQAEDPLRGGREREGDRRAVRELQRASSTRCSRTRRSSG